MNQSEKKIFQREKIYKNIDKSFDRKHGILLSKKINKKEVSKLTDSITDFIYKSLKKFNSKKKISKRNFLNKNINLITKLPNVTPGGQIRGIKEYIREYNLIHKEFSNFLKRINLLNDLERLSWFSVRVKKGNDTLNYKKHMYSTSKKHSDMWAGERNHGKIVLMLMGDVNNNTVSFYKPIKFSRKAFTFGKKSYDQGLQQIQKARFLGKAKKHELCLFDQYCLHKTHLSQNAKPRISIDMRVDISGNKIYNNKKSVKEDERLVLYNRKQWQKINYRNIKYHCKSAKEIEKLYG